MPTLNPYLNFKGKTGEVFEFYKSVFGGEFATFMRFKDMPSEHPIPESEGEKIMHVSLPIGNGTVLMGSDVLESMAASVTEGNNFHISINADSEADADRLFGGLSEGGTVTMPLQKTFWGAYFGMWVDKFGVNWMINYDYKAE